MRAAVIRIFCPMCKRLIEYGKSKDTWHHREFGILCSEGCYEEAGMKYARMILGKDDPVESVTVTQPLADTEKIEAMDDRHFLLSLSTGIRVAREGIESNRDNSTALLSHCLYLISLKLGIK